jgi:hypothetical protein
LLVKKTTSVFKVVKREVAVLKAMERKFSLILRHYRRLHVPTYLPSVVIRTYCGK